MNILPINNSIMNSVTYVLYREDVDYCVLIDCGSGYNIHQFDRFAYIHKCAAKQVGVYGVFLLYSWNGIELDWFCFHRPLL